jgi:prevent-host-death family protein
MDMKEISIQDLKAGLSAAIERAGRGEVLTITRHGDPVARLTPPVAPSVHRPAAPGKRLRPALARGTRGRYLEVLRDDRGGR